MAHGVQVIYQDLALFPNLSVAENVALSRFIEQRRHFFRRGEARRIAREAVAKVGAAHSIPMSPWRVVPGRPAARRHLPRADG